MTSAYPTGKGEDCRLFVYEYEAALDGEPDDLRLLADALEGAGDLVNVALTDEPKRVQRRRTRTVLLRVSVDPGPTLVIEGDDAAIRIVTTAIRQTADAADAIGEAPVPRHAHIEYLGDGDSYRSPDSFPLVITSSWPQS